jgi:hypothetical protein
LALGERNEIAVRESSARVDTSVRSDGFLIPAGAIPAEVKRQSWPINTDSLLRGD